MMFQCVLGDNSIHLIASRASELSQIFWGQNSVFGVFECVVSCRWGFWTFKKKKRLVENNGDVEKMGNPMQRIY